MFLRDDCLGMRREIVVFVWSGVWFVWSMNMSGVRWVVIFLVRNGSQSSLDAEFAVLNI